MPSNVSTETHADFKSADCDDDNFVGGDVYKHCNDSGSGSSYSNYDYSQFADAKVNEPGQHEHILYEGPLERKPYLGGFVHKSTRTEYHHAYTQTVISRESKYAHMPPRCSRETQTVSLVTRSQQVKRTVEIQTRRKDLHQPEDDLPTLTPRPYFTSEQLLEIKLAKVLIIQCAWRTALAIRRADRRRLELFQKQEVQLAAQEETEIANQEREAIKRERRIHPITSQDFGELFAEIEEWRVSETTRVRQQTQTDSKKRQKEINMIMQQENALISSVIRLQRAAAAEKKQKRIQKILDGTSVAAAWKSERLPARKGVSEPATIHVVTPAATRARELAALYTALGVSDRPIDERVELLGNVRFTVCEFNCPLTTEIVSLIDRELHLLSRGRREHMEGLRKRLLSLFLSFIKDPKFNPNVRDFVIHPVSERSPHTVPSFLQATPKLRK